MSQAEGMNQRRFERFNIFERATLVEGSGARTAVILIDVSLGGAQVLAKRAFTDGESCKLEVGVGGDAVVLTGVIRYNKPADHDLTAVGFKMTASSSEERVAIANLVNRIFMNPSEAPETPGKLIAGLLDRAA